MIPKPNRQTENRGRSTTTTTADTRRGALALGLAVLEQLCDHGGALGVAEVAGRVRYDPANVHRLLAVLVQEGYVEKEEGGRYRAAMGQVVALAGALLSRSDFRDVARREADHLAEETREAAHVAVRRGVSGVYVVQVQPSRHVRVETDLGSTAVVHCTATGKAIAAHCRPDLVKAAFGRSLQAYTSKTITSVAALERELEDIRRRGFALDDEEYHDDVRCVAAPVFDYLGDVVGAIGVSAPSVRLSARQAGTWGRLVVDAASAVSKQLGGLAGWAGIRAGREEP